MVWLESGLHKMRLEVTDSEGASSGVEERWVNVQNLPPTIEPISPVLPVAEGQTISVTGRSSDTPSDVSTLIRCWDIDPSMDSDDIGSADDDCDVTGDNLTVAWNRSGTHKAGLPRDGRRRCSFQRSPRSAWCSTPPQSSEPPPSRARPTPLACWMPAARWTLKTTFKTSPWRGTLTSRWTATRTAFRTTMLTSSAKSGRTPSHKTVLQSVKVMAWDEDPERPGVKVITFAVLPADRTPLERIGAALVGEEANAVDSAEPAGSDVALVLLFSRRRRKAEPTDAWDEVSETLTVGLFTDREERLRQKRPGGATPEYLFQASLQTAPGCCKIGVQRTAFTTNGPPGRVVDGAVGALRPAVSGFAILSDNIEDILFCIRTATRVYVRPSLPSCLPHRPFHDLVGIGHG